MCVVVAPHQVDQVIEVLAENGESAWRMGTVMAGGGEVDYV
jgi:phosphoribosylaminoimidazole (AIR) synthetase